jgi:amino acid adenylation domain-containing protein
VKPQTFSPEKRDLLELLLRDQEAPSAPTNGASFHGVQIHGKDAFPLSFSQRRLWFLDQLEPGSAFYNFPLAVPFNVAVNTSVLERAINEIVKRHEALRTTFTAVDGEPMQVVLPSLALPLTVIDLRHLGPDVQDAEMIRLGAEMAQRPFDLAGGPLLRTALLRRDQDHHVFLLVMHHIISDGWSLGIFWRELIAVYNSFYIGRPSPLPDLPIQYADFAVWQRERLQGEKLAELTSYWKQQLSGISPLQLPADRPRPPVLSYRGAFQELVFPGAMTRALRALSQHEGTTLFMTLFAAFAVLLHRYTGQDDIVVGSYVAGRDRAELEDLIGFFINTLVLRADLSEDPSFRTLLGRVREMALNAYAHQELPFEKLVEELQPERDLGRNPLFQVSFQLFSTQTDRGSPKAADAAPPIEIKRGMAIFDIAVNIWDGPDQLSGHVEYSTDLFDPATMARFVGHFRTLLKSILAAPDARLSTLQILTESEQRQLLVEWNETAAATPDLCVHALFEEQVRRSPDAVAVSAGGRDVSYDELNRRANRLAHHLREQLREKDALVAICVERGLDMMVGILAVLKAGAAYVPLDPSYPPERLAFMLQDSGANIRLAEQRTVSRLPTHGATTLLLDDESLAAGRPDSNPVSAVGPDDLCYVIYTSGSTGTPKGVASPHRATVNRLQWMWTRYPFAAHEVVCQKTALSFVDSVWEMFGGILQGVKTVVLSDDVVKDPRKLVDALAAAKVSRVVLVPSLLRALQGSGIDLAEELPALKYWTLSGEAFPYALYAEFRQNLPRAVALNLYGSSEVAADVLCCDLSATALTAHSVPIGRPIANTKAYVLDRNRNLVPIGVPGELHVGGQGLARGYHNRPDLTAERFITCNFGAAAADRLYKTGDLVRYRLDGQIEFLGRLDHQVKVRGYRVELGEIEAVLSEHAGVGEVIASVVQDRDNTRLIAYVVPAQDDQAAIAADPTQDLASRWQTVWNETYLNSTDGDGSFNIVGWNSSYSSEPIPPAEMRQWVDQTVERALSFKPKRVLEIGCGTGLLLLRIAPFCAHYVGTDFSKVALDKVRGELERSPSAYQHVHLCERAATDLDGLDGPFDLVILNSVIQYFPSVAYLSDVLNGAIRITAPTGALLIGDVRSLPLLRALHTAVELHHAPETLTTDVLRARIQRRVAEESELVVDPTMFHGFGPDIAQVTVDLKRGTLLNELTQFRYDVTLRREHATKATAPEQWVDWGAAGLSLPLLETTLTKDQPDLIGITRIPNARTGAALRANELLDTRPLKTVAELRRFMRESPDDTIDPEALWDLGGRAGYDVSIGLLGSGADGRYDAIFRRSEASRPFFGFPCAGGPANSGADQQSTHPAVSLATQRLIAELRGHLQRRLPEHMVPASILLLEAFPRTPNGKVDRRALPAPDTFRGRVAVTSPAPRTGSERRLAAIWAEILNIEWVGISDNFFELGGHSLLATQLVSRIRGEFNNELPVRAIFEAPTIAALAAKLDKMERSPKRQERIFGRGVVPKGRPAAGGFSNASESGRIR